MGARPKPLERIAVTARNSTHKADGRELVKADYNLIKTTDRPVAPRGLQRRGRLEWRKIWESGPWLYPAQDYAWIEQICRAYDDIDTFRKRVADDGLVVTGYAGQPVAHPLVSEIRKCEETIRKCLSIIGYSPTDRARLGLAEVKKETALQEYLAAVRKNKSELAKERTT
jgi:P27 family predicted phage terminase small subunit